MLVTVQVIKITLRLYLPDLCYQKLIDQAFRVIEAKHTPDFHQLHFMYNLTPTSFVESLPLG